MAGARSVASAAGRTNSTRSAARWLSIPPCA